MYLFRKPSSIFESLWALLLLSSMALLLQVAIFIPRIKSFITFKEVSRELSQIPQEFILTFVFQIIAHIFLWLSVTLIIWITAWLIKKLFHLTSHQQFMLSIWLWIIATIAIFSGNQIYFPHSIYSQVTHFLWPIWLAQGLFYICTGLVVLALFFSFITLGMFFSRINRWLLLIIFALGGFTFVYLFKTTSLPQNSKQPNIIIIGIDSLRFDHVGFYGKAPSFTPNLDNFLQNSTQFTQTITPLGRTFPAWISILSGNYPKEHGARYDLIDRHRINRRELLPKILHNAGYHTVYATDERRFSNIDQTFGFDTVIAPRMGYLDFLLSLLNDFPLSNLLMNTSLGQWLFPYNYANRASSVNYNPDTFNTMITHQLKNIPQRPLFLATHLCLPHIPYTWAQSPLIDNQHDSISNEQKEYQLAIKEADRQFKQIIQTLKHQNLLDHALVVVLSDHGEALALPDDRIIQVENYVANTHQNDGYFSKLIKNEKLNLSSNHGTDVFSPSQYHVLLAMRYFSKNPNISKQYHFPTSLIDIKPTILDLLGIRNDSTGISLLSYLLQEKNQQPNDRLLFMETGIDPNIIMEYHTELTSLIQLGLFLYRLDPQTGLITVKNELYPFLVANKQRAIIYRNWLLGLYPSTNTHLPVLVELTTGKWTDNLNSDFARQSPAFYMLKELQKFYGDEIKNTIKTS